MKNRFNTPPPLNTSDDGEEEEEEEEEGEEEVRGSTWGGKESRVLILVLFMLHLHAVPRHVVFGATPNHIQD